ncbi:MAG TPA: fluoride efflux transporter CrcB [Acidimicrobiales bacterium]|nr:fluoride efflux transporter CrcB [Acidimicrobiales bacterium]
MTPLVWLEVAVAGAIGAPARYLLDGFVQDRVTGDLPWGTFAVNIIGSFLLGLLTGLGLHANLSDAATIALGTGFCGAFTTFSTFTFESSRLIESGDWRGAAINVIGSLAIGLVAAGLGLAAGLAIA